jgi:hypothetical protein
VNDDKIDILKDCTDEKYTEPKKKWSFSFKLVEFDANFKATKIFGFPDRETGEGT